MMFYVKTVELIKLSPNLLHPCYTLRIHTLAFYEHCSVGQLNGAVTIRVENRDFRPMSYSVS